jgi:hypothetical protein
LEKTGIKIAYKNAHKKVQKLIDLKLVDRLTDTTTLAKRELERGAKYYRLSEEGIFVLFYDYSMIMKPHRYYVMQSFKQGKTPEDMESIFAEYGKEIFRNHFTCTLFKLFLSPWISTETIENLDEGTLSKIRTFLNGCCNDIKDRLLLLPDGIYKSSELDRMLNLDYQTMYLDFDLDDGVIKSDDNAALSFLKNIFSFRTEVVKVKKVDHNNIIISNTEDTIKFRINYNDEEKALDLISVNEDTDRVSLHAHSIKKVATPNSVLKIIVEGINLTLLHYKAVFSIAIEKINDNDLKLLRDDARFKKTIFDANDQFRTNCEVLLG